MNGQAHLAGTAILKGWQSFSPGLRGTRHAKVSPSPEGEYLVSVLNDGGSSPARGEMFIVTAPHGNEPQPQRGVMWAHAPGDQIQRGPISKPHYAPLGLGTNDHGYVTINISPLAGARAVRGAGHANHIRGERAGVRASLCNASCPR